MKNAFELQSVTSFNTAFAQQQNSNLTGIKAQLKTFIADCATAFNTLLRFC